MIKVLFGQVRPSLPSLVVALGGVGLAYVWLDLSWLLAAVIAVALLALGAIAYGVGNSQLDRTKPKAVSALRWLGWTVAAPLGLAAFAAAAIIVLGISTVPGKHWSEERKQLTAALVAAITTYLTTVFIKGAEDADAGWVGTIVKTQFQKRLKDRFPEGKAQNAVFDLFRGWDSDDRKARAKEIDDYIKEGKEVLPRA
jgi:hypothetical protein